MNDGYLLKRSQRRTLAIEIKQNGDVIVHAPMRLPKKSIEEFLARKSEWIKKKAAVGKNRKIPAVIAGMSDEDKRELAARANIVLCEKAERYSRIMGVKYSRIRITSAEHRFGSCSSNGTICFSYRLILYPEIAQDYVVIHELAHIRYMNHGREFYSLVAKYMPEYKQAEKILKEY